MKNYHIPVLCNEVCENLIIDRSGVYFDGTLGGGGHAKAILNLLKQDALYIGVDRDADAISYSSDMLKLYENFKTYQTTYDKIAEVLSFLGIDSINGALLDLGVSSWQIEESNRGFSYKAGVPLDMRMNQTDDRDAVWILNNYDYKNLKKIIKEFGEEKNAACIARRIIEARTNNLINESSQLMNIIRSCVSDRFLIKSYARVYQALRIEVNDELNILEKALPNILENIKSGGKFLVITYHSLEDRIVKNFFRFWQNPCTCPPDFPECRCGNVTKLKKQKPAFIQPSEKEIDLNPRARSAKLRIGIKI